MSSTQELIETMTPVRNSGHATYIKCPPTLAPLNFGWCLVRMVAASVRDGGEIDISVDLKGALMVF